MSNQAGKGSKPRKNANNKAYWNNFPFADRLTVSQWIEKCGDTEVNMDGFSDIPVGMRITEEEYTKRLTYDVKLTDSDLQRFQEDINSMSFSEFSKFSKH